MMESTSPPLRRKYLQNRYLLLFVGILVASVLATFLQVNSRSAAAEDGVAQTPNAEVTETSKGEIPNTSKGEIPKTTKGRGADTPKAKVTQGSPEAVLHADKKTCIVRTKATIVGEKNRVAGMVGAVASGASKSGMSDVAVTTHPTPHTSKTELTLAKTVNLAEAGATKAHCTTKAAIEDHHGRSLAEVPSWARGMLAAAAATAVYLSVVFAVTATFAFLAPEFMVYGEIAGGCVGGFLSTYVANLINKVPQDANLTQSAVQCIMGAALNISIGEMKVKMLNAIKAWLRSDAQSVAASASHSELSRSTSFFSAISELADAVRTP